MHIDKRGGGAAVKTMRNSFAPFSMVTFPSLIVCLCLAYCRRGLHLFADDTHIHGSCRPEETQTLMDRMSACISDVAEWMQSNCLQLNMTKTELL